jgi:hypothetical protein
MTIANYLTAFQPYLYYSTISRKMPKNSFRLFLLWLSGTYLIIKHGDNVERFVVYPTKILNNKLAQLRSNTP